MLLCDGNLLEYLQALQDAGALERASGCEVRIERAGNDGDGANFVRRIQLGPAQTWIVKQARSAPPRFPEQRLPTERIVFEHRYGQSVAQLLGDPEPVPPRALHFDLAERVLVLEDVGRGPTLRDALAGAGPPPLRALRQLGEFLARVHERSARRAAELAPLFENREMQQVHGERIFARADEPAEPAPGPARCAAQAVASQPALRERIGALRQHYFETREALIHADVQSSNLLLQGERLRLIDAEAAHWGDPAFDLGGALGEVHRQLALATPSAQEQLAVSTLLEGYADGGGTRSALALAPGYAGLHLLGAALAVGAAPGAHQEACSHRLALHAERLLRAAVL